MLLCTSLDRSGSIEDIGGMFGRRVEIARGLGIEATGRAGVASRIVFACAHVLEVGD
jgi:hypothetical protein